MQENGQQLVSGQNCNPQLACQEFLATRTMHRKDSPIYFYHYVQSFHPDEAVTGELAHAGIPCRRQGRELEVPTHQCH
ncbi:MAG: relaxase/mobilization nuclease domain-containing protein, partial [Oscillospiraceae bacterium]